MILKMLAPHTFQKRLALWSHGTLLIGLLLWFSPLTRPHCQQLDDTIFRLFNGSLTHPVWQRFWGLLNHRREVSLNLLLAAGFNLWAIVSTKDLQMRKIRIQQILYFWICFEIGFTLQDVFFNHWLHITRDSPSLILQPVIRLSEVLQDPNIKDTSTHSFPGGHAFSLIYWASFTCLSAPKKIAVLGIIVSVILSLARLYSGAHWGSDVLFSAVLAIVWLSWTINLPLYKAIICQPDRLLNIWKRFQKRR